MAWRIEEGGNEAIYQIGYDDSGNPLGLSTEDMETSMETFRTMAKSLNCEVQLFKRSIGSTSDKFVCQVLVRKSNNFIDFSIFIYILYILLFLLYKAPSETEGPAEIKMAIIGNVDSGKSTFVGIHIIYIYVFLYIYIYI